MTSSGSGSDYFRRIPYKQDMAPPGGYKKLPYVRNLPVRIPLSGPKMALAIGGLTALAWCRTGYGLRQVRELKRETTIAKLNMIPLLVAEGDRGMIKRMYGEYEKEKLLMADVEGWEFGESVFHSDMWQTPNSIISSNMGGWWRNGWWKGTDENDDYEYCFGYGDHISAGIHY